MWHSKNKKTTFRDVWIEDPTLYWARRVEKDVHSCYCVLCYKKFTLSNMGKLALKSHMIGKKHQEAMANKNKTHKIDMFLNNNVAEFSNSNIREKKNEQEHNINQAQSIISQSTDESAINLKHVEPPLQTKRSNTMNSFLLKSEVTKAEIIWCLNTVYAHLSVSASAKCIDIIKLMCSDCDIIKNIKLARTKIAYVIVHGLGPFFHQELENEIKQSKYFSISFDESLNKVSKKEQLDIMILYWCDVKNRATCRYWTSCFLGHTTAADLLAAIKSSLKSFDLSNLIQVSMDGPNVNLKVLKDLKKYLSESDPDHAQLLEIGSCGLHVLNNAFKVGIKSTKWNIIQFLRAIYDVFKISPARKADYTLYTNSTLYPQKFCATRWLNNVSTANRAEEILPNLVTFVKEYKNNKKDCTSASFKIMSSGVEDKLIGPKLAFFKSIASIVEPFLTTFQTEAPMAPFLYTELTNLLQILMQNFIKKDVLKNELIHKIDINKNENIVSVKAVDIGYSTRAALRKVTVSEKEVMLFKHDCLICLKTITSKLLEKSPLRYKLTKGITFCDPFLIIKSEDTSIIRFKSTLEILVETKRISGILADEAEREFRCIISNPIANELLKKFSRQTDRLDEFWVSLLSRIYDVKSTAFLHCLKIIFIIFHGNASVERGFSVNKECLIDNQTSISLIAQRQIWDKIQQVGGIENININSSMIHAIRNARDKYMEFLTNQKKTSADLSAMAIERKRKLEITKELEEKRKRLIEETNVIDEKIQSMNSDIINKQ